MSELRPLPSATLHDGSLAPEGFTLASLDGQKVALATSLRGRPAVINFFASWCTLCRQELTDFAATSRAYGGAVGFIGIDTNDPGARSALLALVRQAGVGYPVVLDTSALVAAAYGISGLPVTFVLDAAGKVRVEFLGRVGAADLRRAVSPLLSADAA